MSGGQALTRPGCQQANGKGQPRPVNAGSALGLADQLLSRLASALGRGLPFFFVASSSITGALVGAPISRQATRLSVIGNGNTMVRTVLLPVTRDPDGVLIIDGLLLADGGDIAG